MTKNYPGFDGVIVCGWDYGLQSGLWVVMGVMGFDRDYGLWTGLRVSDGITGCM